VIVIALFVILIAGMMLRRRFYRMDFADVDKPDERERRRGAPARRQALTCGRNLGISLPPGSAGRLIFAQTVDNSERMTKITNIVK